MYDIPQSSNKKRKKDKVNDSVRLSKNLNFHALSKYNDSSMATDNAVTPQITAKSGSRK